MQPVELYTKRGLRGRIKEPVGTHGMLLMLETFTINLTISTLTVNYLMGRIQIICCLVKDVPVNSMILIVVTLCFELLSAIFFGKILYSLIGLWYATNVNLSCLVINIHSILMMWRFLMSNTFSCTCASCFDSSSVSTSSL